MTTTLLAFGDIHIKPDNAVEIDLLQEKILKLIDRHSPNFVVILGDVLDTHERILSNCLNRAQNLFKTIKNKTELIVLVGNHDQINNKQFLTESHWMNSIKEWKGNITIVDKVITKKIGGNLFVFVPYVESGRFIEALDTIENWRKATLIFAHQEFKNCVMNGVKSLTGDVWSKDYPDIISGHIHINQTLGNIYYPGSIIQTAFGEKCSNIVVKVVVNSTSDFEMSNIRLNLPRQETIELSVKDVDNYDFSGIKSGKVSKLRLILLGSPEEFVSFKHTDKYKELIGEGIKIVFNLVTEKKVERKKDTYNKNLLRVLFNLAKKDGLQDIYERIINEK